MSELLHSCTLASGGLITTPCAACAAGAAAPRCSHGWSSSSPVPCAACEINALRAEVAAYVMMHGQDQAKIEELRGEVGKLTVFVRKFIDIEGSDLEELFEEGLALLPPEAIAGAAVSVGQALAPPAESATPDVLTSDHAATCAPCEAYAADLRRQFAEAWEKLRIRLQGQVEAHGEGAARLAPWDEGSEPPTCPACRVPFRPAYPGDAFCGSCSFNFEARERPTKEPA